MENEAGQELDRAAELTNTCSAALMPPDQANAARIYDWLLGGSSNFAADRMAGQQLLRAIPHATKNAIANRLFLNRVVRYLASREIRQFIDLGSGLPTVGNVHQIAESISPSSVVVYVDNDPVVVEHSRSLLCGNRNVSIVQADLRKPDQVLQATELRRVIDFDRPVAILAASVLHFIDHTDLLLSVMSQYVSSLVPGSCVAISHLTGEFASADENFLAQSIYARTATTVTPRSRTEISALFGGLQLLPPGVVRVSEWNPDLFDPSEDYARDIYGGVAMVVDEL
ncbi:SAM-dependent methyltransferase [Cryptosporangium sp. NPDC051539]|uniref:SAM-dependent methyltransferase n=1 Tax=Cryptosporangium sp. NPDC051539 TaxID=3363962 RepID=UPI0037B1D73D